MVDPEMNLPVAAAARLDENRIKRPDGRPASL
jgi:hypothetical protein